MGKAEMAVMDDALSLPVEARVQLVDKLLQSLNLPTQEEVEEAWAKEVDRRIAEDERGEVKMIPGEEVIAELRRKYGR
ncbi:MAG TPA: addiction module protein [Planctomycetota bacterium]|nr:addiction module protein [Planctomycetota bacterium]